MITESQLWQYLNAQREIEQIERAYQTERQEAYEGIAPTITGFDYGSGRLYKLACHVEDYAIYLVELDEERKNRTDQINKRAEILNEAITLLYEDEEAQFEAWRANPVDLYPEVLNTLKECISFVIERDRIVEVPDEMTVTEWDAQTEEMDDEELFSDYWDRDGSFDEGIRKRRTMEKQYGRVDLSEKALHNYATKYAVKDRFRKSVSSY